MNKKTRRDSGRRYPQFITRGLEYLSDWFWDDWVDWRDGFRRKDDSRSWKDQTKRKNQWRSK